MKLGLRMTRDQLRCELLAGSNAHFEEARTRRPALAAFGSVRDVLEALRCSRPETFAARDAIVRDLALEYRTQHAPLWSKMLLVVFYPAMVSLRARLALGIVTYDEIDQVILTGFLNAVDTLSLRSLHTLASFRICQLMERYVFRFLLRERGYRRVAGYEFNDEVLIAKGAAVATTEGDAEDVAEIALLLRTAKAHGFSEATIALLQATVVGRLSLRKFAQNVEPHDEVARRRLYERLKRRRSRALQRLRALTDVPVMKRRRALEEHAEPKD